MSRRLSRALLVSSLVGVCLAAIVGGTVAGAATAPPPLPSRAVAYQAADIEDVLGNPSAVQPHPNLHVALGRVLRIGQQRFAVETKSGRHIVNVRPATRILIDGRRASLDELQSGDAVVVLGRTGQRGAFLARAIRVFRKGR